MKKIIKKYWTIIILFVHLLSLLIILNVQSADESERLHANHNPLDLDFQPSRADINQEELRLVVESLQEQLEECRNNFVDNVLELKRLREELAIISIQAGYLAVNKEPIDTELTIINLVSNISGLKDNYDGLYRELVEFNGYLNSVIEILDESGASRYQDLLNDKLEAIFYTIKQAERFFFVSLKEDVNNNQAGRVLSVNDELQVVILNIGQKQGAILGSIWNGIAQNNKVITLKIVEVRYLSSAALVTSGRFKHVYPGLTVRRLRDKD